MTEGWELDYKLALLRATDTDLSRLEFIDMSTVVFSIYGDNPMSGGGCETCGDVSSDGYISATLQWEEAGIPRFFSITGESEVSEFVRKVLAP